MSQNHNKISNIFVLMLENHSFDNVFAMSGIPGIRVASTQNSNRYKGQDYHVQNGAPSSMSTDPGHEFPDVLQQLCGAQAAADYLSHCTKSSDQFSSCDQCNYPMINNSGFASSYATSTSEDTGIPAASHIKDIMACFHTETQLPVIYQLANEFAICDAWHSALPGPTWPNRFFVHGASSSGMDRSPGFHEEVEWETYHGFEYGNKSIYHALAKAGHGWRFYQDKANQFSDNPSPWHQGGWISQVASLKGVSLLDIHSLQKFRDDLHQDGGKHYRDHYPYTFIEPNFGASFFSPQPAEPGVPGSGGSGPRYKGGSSQHPEDNPYGGEALIKFVYETIRNSPLWESSLLIINYDEHGGFSDSVAPEPAVPPADPIPESQKDLNSYCFDFSRLGVRVPAVVVSPLIPKNTVDHTVYDHSSVLATLERKFGLAPLTERDKAANDVWHLLSESVPRNDCPATLHDPAKIPPAVAEEDEDDESLADLQLPASGNIIGFLQVLLKAELEIARREDPGSVDQIICDFKSISTQQHARDYVMKMKPIIDALENQLASNS